jgi:hypothetical protein
VLAGAAAVLAEARSPVEQLVVDGDPAQEIVGIARRRDVDLVVLGSRGLGSIGRLLLGSVSETVLHHADRPVVIARARRDRPAARETPAVEAPLQSVPAAGCAAPAGTCPAAPARRPTPRGSVPRCARILPPRCDEWKASGRPRGCPGSSARRPTGFSEGPSGARQERHPRPGYHRRTGDE